MHLSTVRRGIQNIAKYRKTRENTRKQHFPATPGRGLCQNSDCELSQVIVALPKKTARHAKLFAKSQRLFLRPALARRASMAHEQKSEAPALCSFAFGICCASARRCEARAPRELSITSQIQRTFQSCSWVIPAPDCAVC